MKPISQLPNPNYLVPNHPLFMTRADKIAFIISILALIVTAWISRTIFEGIAHLEDEFAYIWQAQVIARGELSTPSPVDAKSFLVPFVVDHEGQRFGKYPLGWPVVLSFGERIGLRWLVNPLLAGLGVWLTYRLGKKTLGETVGLLAAGLTATSPFFLMNSGALLSHPWGLVLTTGFAISWLDMTGDQDSLPGCLPSLSAALTLGVLALSRPFTAIGVAIPFGFHGLILIITGSPTMRKRVLAVGLIAVLVGSLHLLWQYQVTGDPLKNPYTLWWEYDKIGFGPGYGVTAAGHSLSLARKNTIFSLKAGISDLFGWPKISWVFLPFGVWAIRRERKVWLLASVFAVLIGMYSAYWIGAWVFGPRYYYESLFSLTLLTGAGIDWLAGWPRDLEIAKKGGNRWRKNRALITTALVLLLVAGNLIFYTPGRIGSMKGLFGTSKAQLMPFQTPEAKAMQPALIIVQTDEWREYAGLLELASPMLDSPFIFIWSRGPKTTAAVIAAFPDRQAYHYYPDQPMGLVKVEK